MKRKILCALAGLLTINFLNALELVPTQELLASYLQKDSELKNQALELQKARINNQITQINNGFNIKLSTGDMTFTFGDDSSFKVYPGVNASLPQYNNLGLNLNGQMSVSDGQTSLDNASASLSVDIISSDKAERKISLLESERKITEAQRSLASKAVEKEEAFYNSLRTILSKISSIVTKKNSLNDDYIDFEKIKLQGYAKTSSAYIKAEMKVLSSEHELETSIHSLISDYKLFYLDCGYEIEIPENTDFTQLIPQDIPQVEAVDITSYQIQNSKDIESAVWTQTKNQMSRDAATKVTLSANGGYTYKNTLTGGSNTVNAGATASYEGIGLNAGVSVPVSSASSPALTLGLTYVPTTSKKNKLNDQLEEISIEQEQMKVDSAYSSYESAVREKQLKLQDIKWEAETNQKNYEMYVSVEKEMLNYYKQGYISEREYSSAVINTIQSRVNGLINQLDLIIYNDEVKSMFVE